MGRRRRLAAPAVARAGDGACREVVQGDGLCLSLASSASQLVGQTDRELYQ